MSQHIALIQGHPDPAGNHYGHALMNAYKDGAESAGRDVRVISVATLDFPLLQTETEWSNEEPPAAIKAAQETLAWADHLVIFYPLWLGTMPAVLKGFLEQTLRPGFAVAIDDNHAGWTSLLKGKSCRIVVTMGMPGFFYRWFFRAHSLKSLERNILRFVGIKRIKENIIGLVATDNKKRHEHWLAKMKQLGARD